MPRNVWVATAASFLTDASSEMLHNSIPLFLVNVLGAGTALVGVVEGVAESTASLLKLFSGYFSDRIRNRKWLAVLGYGVSTVAKPFLYFADDLEPASSDFASRSGSGRASAPRRATRSSRTASTSDAGGPRSASTARATRPARSSGS